MRTRASNLMPDAPALAVAVALIAGFRAGSPSWTRR